jgi:hypothetical protein
MKIPGLKVFHIQDIDYRSHCLLFKTGLKQLKEWSLNNPNHLPIIITMNAKDEIIDLPGFTRPLVFDEKALNVIDEEIRTIIDDSYSRAENILKDNMEKLHLMADALMKYETIDSDQITDIMEGKTPRAPSGWDNDDSDTSGDNHLSDEDETIRKDNSETGKEPPVSGPKPA